MAKKSTASKPGKSSQKTDEKERKAPASKASAQRETSNTSITDGPLKSIVAATFLKRRF